MKKGEKLKNFLKHPGVWLWTFYAALAFFGAACIIVAVLWNGENPVAYSLYAVTAILLGYCIYASVAPAKALVSRLVHSNKVTERMISDYGYRTTAFLAISLIVNGAYAIFMAVLGIVLGSSWYGLFAGYYVVLNVLRVVVIFGGRKANRKRGIGAARGRLILYLLCGALFVPLSIAFASLAGYLIISEQPARYDVYAAIAMAAYTFYKIIVSAINAVKVRKFHDFSLQAARNVSFADALVSVFALQMAMIATFTEGGDIGEMGTFNIITGAAVFLLTLGMGIYMTVRAAYGLKKLKSAADGGAADGNERCVAREEARDGNQNTDNAAQTGGEGV